MKRQKQTPETIDARAWKWPLKNGIATRRTIVTIISFRAKIGRIQAEAEFDRAFKSGEIQPASNVGLNEGLPAYRVAR